MRDELEKPPRYGKEFFDTDDFRAAFASRQIGRVLKVYRHHPRHLRIFGKSLNQELLGRWLGITQAQVSKLENGRSGQNLETLIFYANTLHLPQHLLWFDIPEQSRLISPSYIEPEIESWELVAALTRSNVTTETIAHVERIVFEYAAQYPSTPPHSLLVSISRQIKAVKEMLDRPQRLLAWRQSLGLLGVLSGLSGSLRFDLGRESQAAEFFDVGHLASREADDPDLSSWLLAARSILPFFSRNYAEAVELLVAAEKDAAIRSTARRRAWIAALLARAAAANGDRDRSLAALDRATGHISEVVDPPTGTDFFDATRLEGIAGSVYMFLADTERAIPQLSHSLDRRSIGDAKGRALLRLDLAECHVIAREPEEAVRLINAALDVAHGTLVNPIMARIRLLRADLNVWENVQEVRELKARVAELSSRE
ncbi:helix-turn-helix domain-containing protein [Actinokineospora sp. G85]|uniref:helix-turn-helix domain-containing protein n=1 Tax=Actinokineospora sp. G85 TaxID=3406626 RepID=UPI003C77B025